MSNDRAVQMTQPLLHFCANDVSLNNPHLSAEYTSSSTVIEGCSRAAYQHLLSPALRSLVQEPNIDDQTRGMPLLVCFFCLSGRVR
jgi:hypothetical protein